MANILFIHQNFPGQFGRMALALAKQGHNVQALADQGRGLADIPTHRYVLKTPPGLAAGMFPNLQAQLMRSGAAAQKMLQLKAAGYQPDYIIAHPGWGDALFVKDVWPEAHLTVFSEWFYSTHGADVGFDPEFPTEEAEQAAIGVRLKNTVHLHAYHAADAIYTCTEWQKAQIPALYRGKTEIVRDYIDTETVKPNPKAAIHLHKACKTFRAGDEVISFVNRNLEPYRGFHVFMRALPKILAERPEAHVVLVGGDEVSYGRKHASGKTWKQVMLEEVGAQLPLERVHFVGKLPYETYLNLLQVSACHVYLTYPFVLSWSCLEAMAAGCALVANDAEPVREVVTDKVNGHLVDFFQTAELADRVVDVLNNRHSPTTQTMCARARQTIIDGYADADSNLSFLLGAPE